MLFGTIHCHLISIMNSMVSSACYLLLVNNTKGNIRNKNTRYTTVLASLSLPRSLESPSLFP